MRIDCTSLSLLLGTTLSLQVNPTEAIISTQDDSNIKHYYDFDTTELGLNSTHHVGHPLVQANDATLDVSLYESRDPFHHGGLSKSVLVGDDEQPMTAIFNSTAKNSYMVLNDCNCSDLSTYETSLTLQEYQDNDKTEEIFRYYSMSKKVNDGTYSPTIDMLGLYVTQNT